MYLKHFFAFVVSIYQKVFLIKIKFRAMYTRPVCYFVIVVYLTNYVFFPCFYSSGSLPYARTSCVNTYILYRSLHLVT